MITTRYIDVAFGGARSAMARALYQYDYGQVLRITDLTLPFAYEVHFADTKTGNSVTMIGNADGVEIPDACLLTSGNVYCWFYLHDTESDGETRYEVLIPILSRAKPTNAAPTPVQQDVIDQAIAALDAAVQQTGEDVIAAGASASAAAGSASDAEAWAVGERDGEPVESTDPTYHNNSKYYAGEAASAAQTASQDAQTASDAAIAAGNAKTAAETAQGKAETAQEKAEAAQTAAEDAAAQTALDVIAAADSADEASGYANTASGYASTASGYAIAAQGHANDASGYASSASGYATNAYNSAQAAAGSAGEASGYASDASGYATDAGNAKTAAQNAQTAAETAQGLAEAAQTGAEAAQTAAESARDAAIAATEDKAPVILDSASGAIVSIVDGANGMNARSLVAAFTPIQDLHGYENPWPAGGGKNKWYFPPYSADVYYARSTPVSESISVNVDAQTLAFTCRGSGQSIVMVARPFPAGQYSVSFDVSNFSKRFFVRCFDSNGNILTNQDISVTGLTWNNYYEGFFGTQQTFTVPNEVDYFYLAVGVTDDTADEAVTISNVQLELGSSITPYAPYSNICPISGRTGVTVERTGINLFDADNLLYTQCNPTDTRYANVFTQSGTYAIKAYATGGPAYIYARKKYADGSFDGSPTYIVANTSSTPKIVTVNSGEILFIYDAVVHTEDESKALFKAWKIQVAYSVTQPDSYYDYIGTTYPVTWQSEAGTVYGGTVDVVTGVLTVTYAMVDLGTLRWYYIGSRNIFEADLVNAKPFANTEVATALCSQYVTKTYGNVYENVFDGSISIAVNSRVYVYDSAYTDVASFTQAMSGVQFCYELATPQTYQLDPQTVSMLLGANNVWATGDSVSLTYPCDTKLYMERLTEPTEDDMVANANIPTNTFFMVGNRLYKSTSAIAQGAAIVVGTNCTALSLADALNALN